MTIQSIFVRHRRFAVCHVRRGVAAALAERAEKLNIISIEYFKEDRPEFDARHNVLALFSHACSEAPFDDEDYAAIREFVKNCGGENVIVHCEMGIMRSRGVAHYIAYEFPIYKVVPLHRLANIEFGGDQKLPSWVFHG